MQQFWQRFWIVVLIMLPAVVAVAAIITIIIALRDPETTQTEPHNKTGLTVTLPGPDNHSAPPVPEVPPR